MLNRVAAAFNLLNISVPHTPPMSHISWNSAGQSPPVHRACSIFPEEGPELPKSLARGKVLSGNLGGNGPPFGRVHIGTIFREQQQPAREALRTFHDTPLPVRSELEHAVGSAPRPKRRVHKQCRSVFCFRHTRSRKNCKQSEKHRQIMSLCRQDAPHQSDPRVSEREEYSCVTNGLTTTQPRLLAAA